jgi:predicted SpoU family rRNA methylase
LQTSLVKALGTYLVWSRLTTTKGDIHLLNCYLEGGEAVHLKQRALRIADIIGDIIRQDYNATIVVCGDFNNQMPIKRRHLIIQGFTAVFSHHSVTHK